MKVCCPMVGVLLACALGCQPPQPSPAQTSSPAAEDTASTTFPATLTVKQNSSAVIPGFNGKLSLSIGDITRGSVTATVEAKDGSAMAGPAPLRRGASVQFTSANATYLLKLVTLKDTLAGDDFATFSVSEISPEYLAEQEKIKQLIAAVEGLQDAVFIRNDAEYKAKDAADHLRRKLAAAGDEIDSAAKFIDLIASKSSVSGEEYTIRFTDGRIVTAGEFLRNKLATLEVSKRNPNTARCIPRDCSRNKLKREQTCVLHQDFQPNGLP